MASENMSLDDGIMPVGGDDGGVRVVVVGADDGTLVSAGVDAAIGVAHGLADGLANGLAHLIEAAGAVGHAVEEAMGEPVKEPVGEAVGEAVGPDVGMPITAAKKYGQTSKAARKAASDTGRLLETGHRRIGVVQ
jgi:hypothetical protein